MIHCQSCKTQNVPDASACQQCGVDLLPSEGNASRIVRLVFFSLFGIGFIAAGLQFKNDFFIYGSYALGALSIGRGVWEMFRTTPVYRCYEIRSNRHMKLDHQQALNDLNMAINHAPHKIPFTLTNFFKRVGWNVGMAYNYLRGMRVKPTLKLKDLIVGKEKKRLISKRLKLQMKLDQQQAVRELVKEIRLTNQMERGDSLRKAIPNRLISLGMKLGEQVNIDKVKGTEKEIQIHWLHYSYVVEANIGKLVGNRIASGSLEGMQEGLRQTKVTGAIGNQLGIERIGMWRKHELKAVAYCFYCNQSVEVEFQLDLNPKGNCSETTLVSIEKCPFGANHELSWPVFVTPDETDEMKKALQQRMAVVQN
jgi:hypothetical protein